MNRRAVFTFFEPDPDADQGEKSKQLDALMEKYGPLAKPTPGASAEQVLSGLMTWCKTWAAHRSDPDRARMILIYQNGLEGEAAGTHTATCDPLLFEMVLYMAAPDSWRKSA